MSKLDKFAALLFLTVGISSVASANQATATAGSRVEALDAARSRLEGNVIVYCESNQYRVLSEDCGRTESDDWMCSIRYTCRSD